MSNENEIFSLPGEVETALYDLQVICGTMKDLLVNHTGVDPAVDRAQRLARMGEEIADRLTDRI